MTHASSQNPGAILDHYADVIEGGNAYASGTSYYGIPGRYSADWGLRTGADTPITADAAGDTTTIAYSSGDWDESRWVKERSPGFFLLCTSGDDAATNKARRITGWDNTAKEFTVDAFPAAPGDAAEFAVLQGFKRLPNGVDVFADETEVEGGYDRYFDLSLVPTQRLDWGGDGTATYQGLLAITLRLLKHGRLHDWRMSITDNVTLLGNILTSNGSGQDHRDGTYVRMLAPPETAPSIEEDTTKIVAAMPLRIVYRVQRGL